MSQARILINASNLHVGGGVQVATSFLDELSRLCVQDMKFFFLVSTEVDGNLRALSSKIVSFDNYFVSNSFAIRGTLPSKLRKSLSVDVEFTIFGPNYSPTKSSIQIVGFAEPWIIYPSEHSNISLRERLVIGIKSVLKIPFFRSADILVVEMNHVKQRMLELDLFPQTPIEIVSNCVSSIYFNPALWQPVSQNIPKADFTIGFLGRDYPHKNTKILPRVRQLLKDQYGLSVNFVVTFSTSEWAKKSVDFRKHIINIGPLSIAQCPSYYRLVDAVIFPSLLECFSATPLEAMIMERPLFASNREFVRSVCGDFAWYFEPNDEYSIAITIGNFLIENRSADSNRLTQARESALKQPNARTRAVEYVSIIRSTLPPALRSI